MIKVNVHNKNLKVIQLLMDEGYLTESFVKTVADICMTQALQAIAKQTGEACLDSARLINELKKEIY